MVKRVHPWIICICQVEKFILSICSWYFKLIKSKSAFSSTSLCKKEDLKAIPRFVLERWHGGDHASRLWPPEPPCLIRIAAKLLLSLRKNNQHFLVMFLTPVICVVKHDIPNLVCKHIHKPLMLDYEIIRVLYSFNRSILVRTHEVENKLLRWSLNIDIYSWEYYEHHDQVSCHCRTYAECCSVSLVKSDHIVLRQQE
jgi:hypothetical protein